MEHLCSNEAFESLISDYLEYLYPLYPLIHRPQFRVDFQNKRYQSDPNFYRLCVSISALSVSCSPRGFGNYGFHPGESVGSMVDKAHQLVSLSRISQRPAKCQPDINDMVCSYILSVACHSSGRTYYGWAHASDAVLCMRKLGLFRKENYQNLDKADSEISKRAFWMIFILMVYVAPSTMFKGTVNTLAN